MTIRAQGYDHFILYSPGINSYRRARLQKSFLCRVGDDGRRTTCTQKTDDMYTKRSVHITSMSSCMTISFSIILKIPFLGMKAGWSCNPAVGTPWRKPFLWRFVLAVPFPEGSVTKPRDEDKSQNVWPHIRLLIHEFINSFIPRSAVSKYRAKRSFFSVRRRLSKRRKF